MDPTGIAWKFLQSINHRHLFSAKEAKLELAGCLKGRPRYFCQVPPAAAPAFESPLPEA